MVPKSGTFVAVCIEIVLGERVWGLWSTELRHYATSPLYDVGWLEREGATVPVVLYRDRTGVGVRFASDLESRDPTNPGRS